MNCIIRLFATAFIIVCYSLPAQADALQNIDRTPSINVIVTPEEDGLIRTWIVDRLSNDDRYLRAVENIITGQAESTVAYSEPSLIGDFVNRVEVTVRLPPGATAWSWSNGGRGVEGHEMVIAVFHLNQGGMQIYTFHRHFYPIDKNRTEWE